MNATDIAPQPPGASAPSPLADQTHRTPTADAPTPQEQAEAIAHRNRELESWVRANPAIVAKIEQRLKHAAEPLSEMALTILAETKILLQERYDVTFSPTQIASAVITAQGIEGCAAAFGLLFAEKAEPSPELDLDDPPLDSARPS